MNVTFASCFIYGINIIEQDNGFDVIPREGILFSVHEKEKCCIFKNISSARKQIQYLFQFSMDIILFNVTLKKAMVEINATRTVLL